MSKFALRNSCAILFSYAIFCAGLTPATAQPQSVSPGAIKREFDKPPTPLSDKGPALAEPFAPGAPVGAAAARFTLKDVVIEGAEALPAETLKAFAAPLIGKETSLAEIYEATVQMTRAYAERGYPLAVAIIPVQTIENGVVRVRIVEGYVSEVEIAGDAGLARGFLERIGAKLKAEKPLTTKALERYVLLANDAPGLEVTAVFDKAASTDGGVKVILKAARKTVDAAIGVNNRGSRALGRLRGVASLAENGLLSGTERVGVDLVQTFDGSELTFVKAHASKVLNAEGLTVALGGSWSTSEPGTALLRSVDFNSDGWSIDLSLAYPLIRSRSKNLRAFAGFEASNLKSRFGAVDNTEDRLRVLSAGAAFDMQDRFGGLNAATVTLRKGLGILNATREADPLKSRESGDGSYVALLATATRRQPLGEHFEAVVSIGGQTASRQLLSSEQCGFGGGAYGRGFDNYEIAGDACAYGSAELRATFAPMARVQVQPYAYYDAGVVRRRGALAPGEDKAIDRPVDRRGPAGVPRRARRRVSRIRAAAGADGGARRRPRRPRLLQHHIGSLSKRGRIMNKINLLATACAAAMALSAPALAGPLDGVVKGGRASIATSGPVTTITQTSDKGIIDWRSFSIGAGEAVSFLQPNASSITLNRVVGGEASSIFGSLTANGRIVLVNPNGILFGAGSRVDVGGLIATTSDISNENFMAGRFVFDRPGLASSSVVNHGAITVRDAGLAAFVAPHVKNAGVINAGLGTVALATGTKYTLDFYGDNIIAFALDGAVTEAPVGADGSPVAALAEAGGEIAGARIAITALAARDVVDRVILADGNLRAVTATQVGGKIVLDGGAAGDVEATGTLDASGVEGGEITLTGARVFADGDLYADGRGASVSFGSAKAAEWTGDDGSTDFRLGREGRFAAAARFSEDGFITIDPTIGDARHAEFLGVADAQTREFSGGKGGRIAIRGANWVSVGGVATANGGEGGSVSINAGGLSIAGQVAARGEGGKGGAIDIASARNALMFSSASLDASGAVGGSIRHIGETQITTSATYAVRGESGAGGALEMTAPATKLLSAKVDASGETGGGRVRIGGEYQGGKGLAADELKNAETLVATSGVAIDASARGTDGAGGEIILWSDKETVFLGAIDAQPGAASGAGGFVEISSADRLTYNGKVETSRGGRQGTVLLDPKNITIVDDTFSQLNLILGYQYTNNPNGLLSAPLESSDFFARALSLSGDRLAVGAQFDDGADNATSNAGAVYLYTFIDSAFNGGAISAVIGRGYSGGRNINVLQLDAGDLFGTSVALDGNSLAIGARGDDGATNNASNAGAVYLFNFISADFSGGALQGVVGDGYAGGKNINLASLDPGDDFGQSVSLDGNRLAVGADLDDGVGNAFTDAGAAYLFSFATSSFDSGAIESILGKGYSGGKNIDLAALEAGDIFATGVSLDGNRLAVGGAFDDGATNAEFAVGAAYLFTFTDSVFNGGLLEATIGQGYVGGKNIDTGSFGSLALFGSSISLDGNRVAVGKSQQGGGVYLYSFTDSAFSGGILEAAIGPGFSGGKNLSPDGLGSDLFGAAVSLDGNRLAVGASVDDGLGDLLTDAGGLYLFSFADAAFSGGLLEARIGSGYGALGGKNRTVSTPVALGSGDFFGSSVSLDGNRLAVGAFADDGAGNAVNASGAIYLFSFADAAFNGGALEATIGDGYTGGKNINLAALDVGDNFGSSVSLDGNRLAVGALGDDGAGNAVGESGAVYLFSFADAAFNGGALEATIGDGYTGGKNINLAALDSVDNFGSSVSLDGNRLAVGAYLDGGAGNAVNASGAVYLFSFADAAFNGGALEATIGDGYTGGKNINLAALDAGDFFGSSVSLDGNRLAVGASFDDGAGNAVGDSGAVYLITLASSADPVASATFANNPGGDSTISVSSLKALLDAGNSVTLQANNDITLATNLTIDNLSGNGGALNLKAGRSVLLNGSITTDNGDLSIFANDLLSQGVVDAFRDPGAAVITMASGTSINAGAGNVLIRNNLDAAKTNNTTGAVSLRTINAGSITVEHFDVGGVITLNNALTATGTGDAIRLATPAGSFQNLAGAGALSAPNGRWLVYSVDPANDTRGGLAFNFKEYFKNYPNLPNVAATGNGFIYSRSASVTPTLIGAVSKTYDGGAAATLAPGNFSASGAIDGDVVTLTTPASGAYDTKNVGTNKQVTASGVSIASATNGAASIFGYVLTSTSASANIGQITQAPLTLAALSQTRVYDGTTASSLTPTATGLVGGDTVTGLVQAFDSKNAGARTLNVLSGFTVNDGNGGGNYAVTLNSAAGHINTAALTVAAHNASRLYGDANPAFSAGITGFVAGETQATALTGAPAFSTLATAASNVGSYAITPNLGTLAAINGNYAFSFVNGTLGVTPAPLTVTADDKSKPQGDPNPPLTATFAGLRNGDTPSVVSGLTLATTAVQSSPAGAFPITSSGGAATNYTITTRVNGTLTVTPSSTPTTTPDPDPLNILAKIETSGDGSGEETGSESGAGASLFEETAAQSNVEGADEDEVGMLKRLCLQKVESDCRRTGAE